MKSKEFGRPGGGRASLTPPLDPPMVPNVCNTPGVNIPYNLIRNFPAIYTIKSLDSGGYEMEFPSYEFLAKIKELLQKIYRSTKWQEYTTRMVTKIFYDVGKCSITFSLEKDCKTQSKNKTYILISAYLDYFSIFLLEINIKCVKLHFISYFLCTC